jgi:squalene-associated FAD-dependent desaturase
MSSRSVLVIGGGLAGLASAVALSEAGIQVQLLEKRPHLGGRATSYTLPDGEEVDNCQHVTLGCCTNLSDFYRRAGAEGKVRFYDRLYFVEHSGRRFSIAASALPPPLHMAPSFACFGALGIDDKRAIARALLAIAHSAGAPPDIAGASMLDWLHRMRQTPGAIERFWRVVLVSALDEELARTDARYGIEVFWKAFLGNRAGYRLGIPSVPLAELYEGCREAVERRGGNVKIRAAVREIRLHENRFANALLEDGSEVVADACIASVPHSAVGALFPNGFGHDRGFLEGLCHLRTAPIAGVHFWFDRVVMKEPFLALLDHTTQWIFNKSLLQSQGDWGPANASKTARSAPGTTRSGQYLQLVISASYDLVPKSRQEIIDLCRAELQDVLPAARDAKLEKATVIKEVHATFSPEPGVDRWRPLQKTPVPNLFLAGDWTRTGWPSTMEGAVRSGYLAAEGVLSFLGEPRTFLRPDLPLQGLSKYWADRRKPAHG